MRVSVSVTIVPSLSTLRTTSRRAGPNRAAQASRSFGKDSSTTVSSVKQQATCRWLLPASHLLSRKPALVARRWRPSAANSVPGVYRVALDALINADSVFHESRGWRTQTAPGFMFCVCSGGYIRLGHLVAEHEFSSTLEVG